MERTIWKYEIVGDEATVEMPRGAEVLPKLHQNGPNAINFWAIIDPQLPLEPRVFQVFGTGFPIGSLLAKGDYIGTVITHHGFVWHVFETTPKPAEEWQDPHSGQRLRDVRPGDYATDPAKISLKAFLVRKTTGNPVPGSIEGAIDAANRIYEANPAIRADRHTFTEWLDIIEKEQDL